MGRRKINNQRRKQEREAAKKRRDQKRLKRLAKGKTFGQKLADKMAGRTA